MFTLNCKGKLLVAETPLVMGIINVTSDSFYAASRFTKSKAILEKAEKMLQEGTDILDIGGQSTRPGSERIAKEEELNRVIPAIDLLSRQFPDAIISVDTYFSKVAREAIEAGASIINDISGGKGEKELPDLAGSLEVPYICVHSKNEPERMHQNPAYKNVTREVLDFFIQKIAACRTAGIKDMIIDPGFGFGKTAGHNFELLKNLSVFKMLEKPVLIGISRKGMIYNTLGITADEALNGTSVLNTVALLHGADILRVHDVKEAKQAIRLFSRYNE
jgi:dihydropteroate synthase